MSVPPGGQTLLVPAGRGELRHDLDAPTEAGGPAYVRKRGRRVADRTTTASRRTC